MTRVTIDRDRFLIDGEPTYKGRSFQGDRIEGLLLNSRMVQATFDDANPETRPTGPIRTAACGTRSETCVSSSMLCRSIAPMAYWP